MTVFRNVCAWLLLGLGTLMVYRGGLSLAGVAPLAEPGLDAGLLLAGAATILGGIGLAKD